MFDLPARCVREELNSFFLHAVAFEGKALKILDGPDRKWRSATCVATK